MNYPYRAARVFRLRREVPEKPVSRRLSLVIVARLIMDQARRRIRFLPGLVFEDPQWLMTLELFIAAEEGRDVSVTNLCNASGIPPTTALRHIRNLQDKGIFERVSHPRDRRIVYVRLAETARKQVARYLASIDPGPNRGGIAPRSSAD